MPFQKGNPGRPKGALNKSTVAAKEFLTKLVEDPKVQRAVKRRVLQGETAGFFRAIDKIVPDPPRDINLNQRVEWYTMPEGDDVADR